MNSDSAGNPDRFESIPSAERSAGMARFAYTRLREMVRSGRLSPGDLLSEQKLSTEIGVGRTPVREAVSRLDQEGLLERLPKRGVRLRTLELGEIRDLYELRGWLEGICVRRATEVFVDDDLARVRALIGDAQDAVNAGCSWGEYRVHDEAFHSSLWAACDNLRAIELLQSLSDSALLDPTFQLGLAMPTQGNISVADHLAILDAIQARDPDAAEAAMNRHVHGYLQLLAEQLLGPRTHSSATI